MVFGKRDPRDAPQEELIGSLYSDAPGEPSTGPPPDARRDASEGILDSHARFNGKFVSDRDLRIDGEAQGEIECQGTLVLSPQARVRASIKAHNVVVNGDYEGNVDSGGRFEIGSTGRVKGEIKTQVLVIKEGAFFEGSVIMARKTPAEGAGAGAGAAAEGGSSSAKSGSGGAASSASAGSAKLGESADAEALFSKEILGEPARAGAGSARQATGPGDADR
ncbi:MAG TPA: polymer-forming cytoskeletal protein [Pleomorphomonadaceae bacterium]|nr:polymer-forming cytoskeletal protein [Pleomorphomonadaceae bacterium]